MMAEQTLSATDERIFTSNSASRLQWPALLGIFLAALALRVVAVLLFGLSDVASYDENMVIAANLAQGHGFAFNFYGTRPDNPLWSFMPPLYPIFVAFFLRYFPQPVLALELTQALLSSLTAMLVYAVAVKLSSNRTVGWLSSIGVAVYPVFIIMSGYPVTVTVNTFLLVLFVLISVWLRDKVTLVRVALAGLVLGLLVLTRPSSIGLWACLMVWMWFTASNARRQKMKAAAAVIAVALITILPWGIRNYQITRQFVFVSTNGGFTFWQGNNPFTTGSGFEAYSDRVAQFLGVPRDPAQPEVVHLMPYLLPVSIEQQLPNMSEIALDKALFQAGVEFIRDNPGRGVELVLSKLQALWWFRAEAGAKYDEAWVGYYKILYAALLAAAIPGTLLSFWRWRNYLLVYFILVYLTLTYVAFNAQVRYRWDMEPFLIIFAALAIVRLWAAARLWQSRLPGPGSVVSS